MPGDEPGHNEFESTWKEQQTEHVHMTADEVCTRARAYEKKIVREYWLVLGLLALFAAKAALYFIQFSAPLARVGWAWGIAIFFCIGVRWARNGPPRPHVMSEPDSCVNFLRSELKTTRERLLEIRRMVLLLFPGMLAGWWAGAPVEIARRLGLDAPWYTRLQRSPAPPIAFALLLVFLWIAFGKETRAVEREIETLGGE